MTPVMKTGFVPQPSNNTDTIAGNMQHLQIVSDPMLYKIYITILLQNKKKHIRNIKN